MVVQCFVQRCKCGKLSAAVLYTKTYITMRPTEARSIAGKLVNVEFLMELLIL